MKLTKEELTEIQTLNTDFSKKKMMLGDIEIQKAAIISEIGAMKMQFAQNEQKLIEKYGKDAVINLQTGEVKQKEE
jgi:predicted  nucleic acid-binding Zn-ribbon protein